MKRFLYLLVILPMSSIAQAQFHQTVPATEPIVPKFLRKGDDEKPPHRFTVEEQQEEFKALLAESRAEKTDQWEKTLTAFAAKENATIFSNIGSLIYFRPPIPENSKPQGVAAMKAMAGGARQEWVQKNGVQIFSPARYTFLPAHRHELADVVAWIRGLNEEDTEKLTHSGLVLSQVPPDVRDKILRVLPSLDMHFIFLERWDKTRLRLNLQPVLKYYSERNKMDVNSRLPLPPTPTMAGMEKGFVYVPPLPADAKKVEVVALEKSPTGPLDFGAGAVLPLGEILTRAKTAFGEEFKSASPDKTWIFVSGSYSKEAFQAALDAGTVVTKRQVPLPETQEKATLKLIDRLLESRWKDFAQSQVDTSWMIQQLQNRLRTSDPAQAAELKKKFGGKESLPGSLFVDQKTVEAGTLAENRPGFQAFLKTNDLPNDLKFTLDLNLMLVVETSGYHEDNFFYTYSRAIYPNTAYIGLLPN